MKHAFPPDSLPRGQRGFSLLIAMVMLTVIGLASAAIMRNATSAEQLATNSRLQAQAMQFSQIALRFCESQLALAPAARVVEVAAAASVPAFTTAANWTAGGGHAAHTLAASETSGSVPARVSPQCLAEASEIPHVYTLTARGFSPDFTADPSSGLVRSGAVVWLQATVLTSDSAAAASMPASGASNPAVAAGGCTVACVPQVVHQRLWQQLLTPPF